MYAESADDTKQFGADRVNNASPAMKRSVWNGEVRQSWKWKSKVQCEIGELLENIFRRFAICLIWQNMIVITYKPNNWYRKYKDALKFVWALDKAAAIIMCPFKLNVFNI